MQDVAQLLNANLDLQALLENELKRINEKLNDIDEQRIQLQRLVEKRTRFSRRGLAPNSRLPGQRSFCVLRFFFLVLTLRGRRAQPIFSM